MNPFINMHVLCKRLVAWFIPLSILFGLSCQDLRGQYAARRPDTTDTGLFRIQWVANYPPERQEPDRSVFDRISEFLFGGEESVLLSKPVSLFAESPDLLWLLDQGIMNIARVENKSVAIPKRSKDGYPSLVGICRGPDNDLYFTDSRMNRVWVANDDLREIVNFRTSTGLSQPTGIAYSSMNDEIWVVETAAHRVSVFSSNGELVKQIGSRGTGPLEFNFPTFIWIDSSGSVYIVDSMNFRIQLLNKTGQFISHFGQAGDATGYFARPKGLATDSHGNIYVVDALFHSVQIYDRQGRFLYHFGSQGRANGQFWLPTGIFIDKNDYIYVADSYNSRIQIFQLVSGETRED